MRRATLLPVLLLAARIASGQPSPGVADLAHLAPGVVHSGIAAQPDPTQTYELYLPAGFDPADTHRRWPLLMIFDPRSRGALALDIFRPAADRWGWILASSDDTRSDGPFDPNVRAVNAMFPDLVTRLPVDPKRIYATGFSGGAILSWVVGQNTGSRAGVISGGGRPPDGFESEAPRFALWAEAGTTDFNHDPTIELDELAAKGSRPHRLEFFDGPHGWFDAAEASRAVAWMELVAMKEGLRPVDPAAVSALRAADLAGAEALLAAGDKLAALRRFSAVAETFHGLADAPDAARRATELGHDPDVRRALEDERWGRRFEVSARRRIGEAVYVLRNEAAVPPLARLEGILDLPAMKRVAGEEGPRGAAGRRALVAVHVQFNFYQTRDLFRAGDYARAVPALILATESGPADPIAWYNLACARARTGHGDEAVAALRRAVELGIPAATHPAEDPDLASLRGRPDFEALAAAAHSPAAGPAKPTGGG
jgi:dienelactone hydrolase